ncbi:MAG: putative Ig domain-containing protein, partial [Gemmatimonas sp.]
GSTTRSIVVNCPAISVLDGSLMLSTTGTTYTQSTGFSANSNPSLNTAGYGWSLVTPPTGFSIGATNGRLTVGNTVAAGLYSLNVRATANAPYSTCLQTQATNYRVCPVFTWTPSTLPNAPVGVNYNTVAGTQVAATGSAAISSYTITGGPAWLSINNSGVLSGTPPAAATAVTFTVNAFDANNCVGSRAYTIDAVPVDYGDYPAFGAASQIAGTAVFIGSNATDGEMTSPSTGAAVVDDTTGTDDEDLVMPVVLTDVGAQPVMTIPVTLAGGVTAGRIGAWIDWNGDNDVADTNETVTLSTVNLVAGLNTITATLNPPLGTTPGDKFMRIRVTEGTTMPALSGLSYLRGEVEDYAVQVRSPLVLFGMEQRSNTGIPAAQSAVPSTYLAPCVTSQPLALYSGAGGVEFNGLVVGEDGNPEGTLFPNITITTGRQLRSASGWDTTLYPGLQAARSSLTPAADSAPFTFTFGGVTPDTVISGFAMNCARMSGAPNQVQVYLTWHDGTAFRTAWTSPVVLPESYYSGTPPVQWQTVLMDGFTNGFTLPTGAALSNTTFLCEVYAFGGTGSLMIDNVTLLGTSVCAITDLGDWAHATNPSGAATSTATSVVNSTLRLGATVDAEFIVTAGAAATWDDATNNGSANDEDGVTMPASIAAGASVTIPVSLFNNNTAGRYLKGWIDFNNDGVFNDVDVTTAGGERISNLLTNANAAQQTVNVNFTVPVGASVGSARGVRFRVSDNVATTPVSSGAAGETEDYVVNIACPVISIADGALMLNTTGTAYTQATGFSATSVLTGGYSWSLVTPPSGFTIGSADGRLTVASSVPVGGYSVTVRAASLGNVACLQDKTASYRVCPVFTWTPASLPNAVVGQNYNSIGGTVIAATGSAAIVNYSLTGAPSWLTINSSGQLSGTPTASAASATFTINATDANGCTGSTTRTVTVVCPTFSIANGTLMLNTTGTAYTQATGFAASSNSAISTAGYAWSLVTPPAGFTIGAADGRLTIANTVAAGVYNLSVRATANAPYATCAQDKAASYRVCPIFTWTPASLPNAVVGQNYNSIGGTVIAATGSAAITNYTLTGAPSWLSITSAGQLQGTPTASAASATFTINATDANGCTGSTTRSITVVCPTFSIANGTLMLNTTGTAYTQATGFAASSNAAINTAGYAWSLVTPPAGFTIGAADGRLAVANTVAAGLYSLNVSATANAPYATCAQTKTASYRVCPIFTWTPASLPNAVVGQNYSSIGGTAIAATGSTTISSYTLSGAPSWLSINSSGQLQGTP